MRELNNLRDDNVRFHSSIDGLWDIGAGLCLILSGIAFLLDAVAFVGAFYVVIFFLVRGLKSKVTYPRIGYVNHKGMKAQLNKMLLVLLAVGGVFMALVIYLFVKASSGNLDEAARDMIANNFAVVVGAVAAALLLSVALIFRLRRFLIYSALIFICFVAVWLFHWESVLPVLVTVLGGALTLIGAFILSIFLRKYPRLDGENNE